MRRGPEGTSFLQLVRGGGVVSGGVLLYEVAEVVPKDEHEV